MMKPNALILRLLLLLPFTVNACSSKEKAFDPNDERKFFTVAVRKLPPEPVYNRLKVAYLPEPLPQYDITQPSYSKLSPVFHLSFKGASLEHAARVLANTARYTSYTSSVIATRKVTIEGLGTIDELGDLIEKKAGINVVVDHHNREVRFLANGTPAPQQAARASTARSSRGPEATTLEGIAASPLSADKFSDETLERLTNGSKKKDNR